MIIAKANVAHYYRSTRENACSLLRCSSYHLWINTAGAAVEEKKRRWKNTRFGRLRLKNDWQMELKKRVIHFNFNFHWVNNGKKYNQKDREPLTAGMRVSQCDGATRSGYLKAVRFLQGLLRLQWFTALFCNVLSPPGDNVQCYLWIH